MKHEPSRLGVSWEGATRESHCAGIGAERRCAPTWPAAGPPVVWKKDVGQGFAGPVVASGKLILFHRVSGKEIIECLDAATGKSSLPGGGTGEHTMAGMQCLLTGTNIARWFIWDGIRAFDYLLTRADVDPKRIGVAGNSGGGTQSSYLAALEPRLAAAAGLILLGAIHVLYWWRPSPTRQGMVFSVPIGQTVSMWPNRRTRLLSPLRLRGPKRASITSPNPS